VYPPPVLGCLAVLLVERLDIVTEHNVMPEGEYGYSLPVSTTSVKNPIMMEREMSR